MALSLEGIGQRVGGQVWLHPLDLAPTPGAVTVLLGATRAGKTTLMRIMAGLDAPSEGRVKVDGRDVTGMPVRERNVAMVYQQFINYPSMTVARNIASPLKLRGVADPMPRVRELAAKLHIEPFLERLPSELSGGQQQRVALARALAKDAPLMLLDEPLVNLDYKLREALREELTQLFAAGESTVIYATTEPAEALLLGGWTAVLDEGRLLQYGPTADVYHRPCSIRVARAFSDPPMNLLAGHWQPDGSIRLGASADAQAPRLAAGRLPGQGQAFARSGAVTVGVRPGVWERGDAGGLLALPARVELAEIAGSDTYLHASSPVGDIVAQWPGVQAFELGAPVTLGLDPARVHLFGPDGALLAAPDTV